MKKLFALLLGAALLMSLCASAEFDKGIWEVFEAGQSFTADFDNDESEETMTFSASLNEWEDGEFTLTVGDSSVTVKDCICLESTVYAMKAGYSRYYYGTVFMINEFGPSDDPLSYCFLYTEGRLIDLGMIPALVSSFDVSARGVITTYIRADMVGTWSRAADFVIAVGSEVSADGEWYQTYHLCEVPRPMYPMGMPVTLKVNLTLSSSIYDMAEDVTIPAGTRVILAASDDVSRLYVTDYKGENKGWVKMTQDDWMDKIMVNGVYTEIDEVFDDVFYAD